MTGSRGLLLRVGSATALLAVVLGALTVGGWAVAAVIAGVVALGVWEASGLLTRLEGGPQPWLAYPLALWLGLRGFVSPDLRTDAALAAAVIGGLIGLVLTRSSWARWLSSLGVAAYVGLTLGYYPLLLGTSGSVLGGRGGRGVVLVLLASVMAGDTAAYAVGSTVGRHRFFASLSPRKSIEGAVAGALATVAVWTGGASLVTLAPPLAALLGLLVAVAAQAGDLVESALKRQAGVKDSSHLIPGHGGLLDRLDSLLLSGPVVYCYLTVASRIAT